MDQFGRKRCQKKSKDVGYKLLLEFFEKKIVAHEWSAVENSFITDVCYAPDVLFWTVLYFKNIQYEPLKTEEVFYLPW